MTVSNCFCKKTAASENFDHVNGGGVSDKNFRNGRANTKKWENLSQIFVVEARDGISGIKVVLREYNSIKIYFPIHIFISQPFRNVHKERKGFFTVLWTCRSFYRKLQSGKVRNGAKGKQRIRDKCKRDIETFSSHFSLIHALERKLMNFVVQQRR